jgi:hypothetical protein
MYQGKARCDLITQGLSNESNIGELEMKYLTKSSLNTVRTADNPEMMDYEMHTCMCCCGYHRDFDACHELSQDAAYGDLRY